MAESTPKAPLLHTIARTVEAHDKNSGFEGSVVVEKVKSLPAGEGLNSVIGEYGDMIKMGVIDPVKVTRTALLPQF
jgi:chaperonin GroEL